MQQKTKYRIIGLVLCLAAVAGGALFSAVSWARAQSGVPYTVDIVATVPGCGDGIIQAGEQCDGSTFGGASCSSLGFSSGVLNCSSVCTHITTACVLAPPQSGAATRVVERQVVSAQAHIVVSGYAAPGIAVTLLKDGQPVGIAVPNDEGVFQITVTGVAEGNHQLQVVSVLRNSIVRSVAITARVIKETTTRISTIVLPPHFERLSIDGEQIVIEGIATPEATIEITSSSGDEQTVVADQNGLFTIRLPRTVGDVSITSIYQGVRSSEHIIPATLLQMIDDQMTPPCVLPVDRTNDCRVNVLDFTGAVQAFFFKTKSEEFDFDNNGQIDIVDFSIMAYYWTG